MPPKDHVPETNNSHKRGRKLKDKSGATTVVLSDSITIKNKGGRPKGAKDTKPRKQRSDKGKPREKRSLK